MKEIMIADAESWLWKNDIKHISRKRPFQLVVRGEVETWMDFTKTKNTTSLPDCLEIAMQWILQSVHGHSSSTIRDSPSIFKRRGAVLFKDEAARQWREDNNGSRKTLEIDPPYDPLEHDQRHDEIVNRFQEMKGRCVLLWSRYPLFRTWTFDQ